MSETNEKDLVFVIPARSINHLQRDSILRTIKRTKQAHFTNVEIRINGQYECEEADWIKHMELQP